MEKHELELLLYQAKAAEYGLVIDTDNAERLRTRLYPIKKASPSFACLSFTIAPSGQLWILNNG